MAGLLLLMLPAGAVAITMATAAVKERRQALLATSVSRLEALAHGRAEVLAAWIDGKATLGGRLTGSELVQLFATELAMVGADEPLPEALQEQMPYMRTVLDDLTREGDLVGVYLVAADGRLLLSDTAAPPLSQASRGEAAKVANKGGRLQIGSIAPMGAHFVADLSLPIAAVQPEVGFETAGVALVLRLVFDSRLTNLLQPGPLDMPGERVELRLARGSAVAIGDAGDVRIVEATTHDEDLLRATSAVGGTDWVVEQTITTDAALQPLVEFRRSLILAMIVGVLLLAIAMSTLWWRQALRHQTELIAHDRERSSRLRQQRDLLKRIMSAVPDLIGLKTAEGAYAFVNPAMANALSSIPENIVGRRDADLFHADAAAVLERLDKNALATGGAASDDLELVLHHRRRHLKVVVVPLDADETEGAGTVVVARDVTEALTRSRERERLIDQTISALERTIDLADPYLLGHSRRMSQLAAELALELGLDSSVAATVRTAATLSQIGKTFVPRELLTKAGRHDKAERQAMRRHVDHTQAILRDIDFDLPVAAAIGQIHERLDGTGYPIGLKGGAISPAARVLAVADVFCARTRPRSYREASPAAEVLAQMRDHPERYDLIVVTALTGLHNSGRLDQIDALST